MADLPGTLESDLASGVPADQLVPCDVAGMGDVAVSLRAHAAVLEEAGACLARVEVTSWRGRASEGFTDVLAPEPARWRTAADAFRAGADALDRFMAVIGPARSLAADAIGLWQRYLASADAVAALAGAPAPPAVNDRLMVGARIAQQQAAASGGPAASLAAEADSLRRQAIATLASARSVVESAGDLAAAALARACEPAPQARRFWESTIRPADAIAAGHSALDVLGMVPALGAIPDAVNAGWYALKGDGVNAALSAAGTIPFFGDAALLSRIARNLAMRPAKLTRGLANPIPEVLFIAGSDTFANLTPRLKDSRGLSSYDNLDVDIFRNGGKAQIVETSDLKSLRIYGPDARDGHYSIRSTSWEALKEWMAARGQPDGHELAQELRLTVTELRLPRRTM